MELDLTGSLEDYLETVYELQRDHKVARVKDIARLRGVKPASVTPAMRRLAEQKLINYGQREFIDLTAEGERVARRIFARHRVLTRFFTEFLGLSPEEAQANGCAMEHQLSDQAMDQLVRFFEFLEICPEGGDLLSRFRRCPQVHDSTQVRTCEARCELVHDAKRDTRAEQHHLGELSAGEQARVTQVDGVGPQRQRLLDMGLLPDTPVEVRRQAGEGGVWIGLQGYELRLSAGDAASVLVDRVPGRPG